MTDYKAVNAKARRYPPAMWQEFYEHVNWAWRWRSLHLPEASLPWPGLGSPGLSRS